MCRCRTDRRRSAIREPCRPAVASFRRAPIRFHASATLTITCTLPAARLIDRKAGSWAFARASCSLRADITAWTSATPAVAWAPAHLAVHDNCPKLRSAELTARLSPSSAPSSATKTEIRLLGIARIVPVRLNQGSAVFSAATVEAIGSYVYVLTDQDDRIFYIGKGQGNRVFGHVDEVRRLLQADPSRRLEMPADDDAQDVGMAPKRQRVADILRAGKTPGMYIVREGLTPEQALLIEAALISVLDWQMDGVLTNQSAGHGTGLFGLKSVADLEATKGQAFRISDLPNLGKCKEVIAINVNRRWLEVGKNGTTLLDIAKGIWRLNPTRASKCPYAIIHANGIVRGVFAIEGWNGPDDEGRFTFMPKDPQPLAGANFCQRNASSLFGATGSGSQNPIRYVPVPK